MATITKRNNSYRIRVSCGYDINGKQIMKSTTWTPPPKMTEKQIEKELQRQALLFEEKCVRGQFLDGSITLSAFIEKWFQDYAEPHLKQKTVDRYHSLSIRINDGLGHIRLNQLQPHHIMEFMNNLADDGLRGDQKVKAHAGLRDVITHNKLTIKKISEETGLSKSTISVAISGKNVTPETAKSISSILHQDNLFTSVNSSSQLSDRTQLHYFRFIHSVLTDAVQWQVILSNPCERVKAPTVRPKEARYLDDEQTSELLKALDSQPIQYQVLVRLALYTGLRRGELLGLKWEDIDFKQSLLQVNRALLYSKNRGLYEDTPKNNMSVRVLKISSGMIETLQIYKTWKGEEERKLGDKWISSGYLFTSWNGSALRPDTVSDWFRKFIAKTELPPISLHSLRHTSATLQIMNGIPLRTVSARLGHSKTSTTSDIYSHAIKSADAAAADVLDMILSKDSNCHIPLVK